MARTVPRGVLLSERDCALLDGVLVRALRDLHMRDGAAPRDLVDVVADIHQVAREFRASVLTETGSGTAFDGSGSVGGSSEVTERLSVQEAARLTGLSTSYLRRAARRGDVQASRSGPRGEWVLDGGAVAAWTADRTHLRKAG
jgi:hypothetical protein